MLSTGYVKFMNNRVVPEAYVKLRQDRINKTMYNVQKELASIRGGM
jgi:hypothetical protein